MITKRTFYPGATVIKEGTNNLKAYIIVSGECNLACHKSGSKLTVLEYEGDPTKAKRDMEEFSVQNPYKK